MADPPLFLHEVVDIVGRGAAAYMAHANRFDAAGAADRGLELLGTWEVVGTTGRWPQVVNLWEIDGWAGWARLCRRTNVAKAANAELAEWWDEAYRHRTGGLDRLLRGAPGCPTLATLRAAEVRGSWFVHELSDVRPGAAGEYLAAVLDERAPDMAVRGITLVGVYENVLSDTEVCTIWAGDLDAHTALLAAGDPWRERARAWCTRWHEELMTPGAGTPLFDAEDAHG